ncbi:MAG: DNA polymerase I [Rhodocyclaceae bacterium]
MPTLLLVDASSYLYRAFHAMPDLRNRAGEPTGAIYGVLNMLRRLRADFKADYCACVFDAKGKTFRDDLYPQYKANRPAMPEDLAVQIPALHEAIRALGWPLLAVEGVEADDVIGTLARQAAAQGMDCIVSTGDKDLAQLVGPRVTLINTMSNETLDAAGVERKFGVPPARIVDYLALVGDAVDNVPGVDKVGPKTAAKWIAQYGSLDALLEHAGEIGGAAGENLKRARDFLPLARRLLTVACELDLPVALSDLRPREPDRARLAELFSRLGFRTLLEQIGGCAPPRAGEPAAPVAADPAGDFETILDWPRFDVWMDALQAAPLTALATLAAAEEPMRARLAGIAFALPDGRSAYLPLAHRHPGGPAQLPGEEALARLRPWLESPDAAKLGHDLKHDMHVFANHGLKLAGAAQDTMLASYVLESDKGHDLDALARRHLGIATTGAEALTGKGSARIGFDQVEIDRAAAWGAQLARLTLRVHHALAAKLAAQPRLEALYRGIELPVMEVLFRMERNGVLVDCGRLARQSGELGAKMLQLEARAHELAGQPFNINSPRQIQEILFERGKLPVLKKTPSGAPSTDEEVLERLALDYPLPRVILDYRALAKLKGTYTDKLPRMVDPDTGRVHTSFSQATAVTGRLASSDPNLQNIPVRTPEGRRIRAAFVAPPGSRIVSADYSQIELRVMAHLSRDAGLLRAFAAGEDVHRATAAEVFGVEPAAVSSEQRRYAKVINFGLIYGMSAFGLARELGLERSAAQGFIDRYFARYPGVARFMEETRSAARSQGYVETLFGRRMWATDIRSGNAARRSAAERAAINAPMQGSAADLVKRAMIAVSRWLAGDGLRAKLILQVHDELVLEVPEDELDRVRLRLPGLMGGVAELAVPLAVDVGVGANWDEAH